MIEIEEILFRWEKGMSKRRIASSLGISRNTVKSILLQAQKAGLEEGGNEQVFEKAKENLCALRQSSQEFSRPAQSHIAQHHEQIAAWVGTPHMTVTQMVRLFREAGQQVSESSLRRYMREHFSVVRHSTVHLETPPGQQAQVDFAAIGLMKDPLSQKMRKAYAFIMTLSYSRYRFVRFVFKQDVQSWVDCHIRAFHFFGGVPETIMPDNLKSGIEKADMYDPVINRAYGELEKHYGFVCVSAAMVNRPLRWSIATDIRPPCRQDN